MKKINVYLGLIFLLILGSCQLPSIKPDFREFAYNFGGEYIGMFYKTKGGETVYFDSTNTPVFLNGGGANQLKLTVGDSVLNHIKDVYANKRKSKVKRQNGRLILEGIDIDGVEKSIRLTATERSINSEIQIIVSNFIIGDYNSSKDTVDIYYKLIGSGIAPDN